MPSKQAGLQYATVTEEKDGSLACSCQAFDQTGKACVHIKAARLQIAYGPVTDYIELETIQKTWGIKAKGQKQNPSRPIKGHHHQAVSDAAVSRELDKILSKLEDDSDSEPPSTLLLISDSDEAYQSLYVKILQKGPGVTPSRPPQAKPLHPNRTPVQFSQKPGPKPKPHNSLLPSQSKSPTKPVNFSPKKSPSKSFIQTKTMNQMRIWMILR
ncbi:uncharacterized protein LACBIDRAFT_297973 [Laccaria bicolor S238N-H82]|uniref:Predicted protein n=1 Tax=Laccaria bicolor (strain S238N-H82 / ATCC MYA-4686) TaxID=486041 RepID=B0DBY9_LACBS|nr:uncharacterized protein LACBIDRAFT_297973 [Laccaria bicolor S238N-H82]EDR07643.1 predicted protein [Laccaria bicolor S238N-H82]|eukprot:XP_001881432.1 predicted protein [Laccaria bicolor S238N-H82]